MRRPQIGDRGAFSSQCSRVSEVDESSISPCFTKSRYIFVVKDAFTASARAGVGEPHPGFRWLTYPQTPKLNRGDKLSREREKNLSPLGLSSTDGSAFADPSGPGAWPDACPSR